MREHVIEVRESAIHGKGVFAKKTIRKNRRLCVYKGHLLTPSQHDDRYGEKLAAYSMMIGPFGDSKTAVFVDASEEWDDPLHWSRYVNDPRGTGNEANIRFESDGSLVAICDIEAGDELLVRYGDVYWKHMDDA